MPDVSIRSDGARVLIVDDEPLARLGLRRALMKMPRVASITECTNGLEAVAAITAAAPDLVVLDVQMPGLDGLEVVRRVGPDAMPPAVFVTAHDAYAVPAFELAAIDYVLKPYTEGRVRAAVERGLDRLTERGAARTLHRLLAALGTAPPNAEPRVASLSGGGFLRRILATAGRRGVVIPVDDILWIGADDYCATINTAAGKSVVRESLGELERRLDPEQFVRIHRSAIVRLGAVRGIRRDDRGGRLELLDGSVIPVSRSRLKTVVEALGGAR
jgi:two-component system, LytTR family, response regulator